MYTKIIKSGDLIELYEYEKEPVTRRQRIHFRGCTHIECGTSRRCHRLFVPSRRFKNLYAARKAFYRLVRCNLVGDPPCFLTVTMLDIVPLVVANKLFTSFLHRLGRGRRDKFRFIAVPEFQKRGAVHYHLLVWGFTRDELKNEIYTRAIQRQWGYGYVDAVPTDGHAKLAGYLAKYMYKTMQDVRLSGKKAYSTSRNLLRPVQGSSSKSPSLVDFIKKEWCIDSAVDNSIAPEKTREYTTQWLGKGRYSLFVLAKNKNIV